MDGKEVWLSHREREDARADGLHNWIVGKLKVLGVLAGVAAFFGAMALFPEALMAVVIALTAVCFGICVRESVRQRQDEFERAALTRKALLLEHPDAEILKLEADAFTGWVDLTWRDGDGCEHNQKEKW